MGILTRCIAAMGPVWMLPERYIEAMGAAQQRACQDTAADGNGAGEGALVVDVGACDTQEEALAKL